MYELFQLEIYSVRLGTSVDKLEVKANSHEKTAKVTINDSECNSSLVELFLSETKISVQVTSPDGTNTSVSLLNVLKNFKSLITLI